MDCFTYADIENLAFANAACIRICGVFFVTMLHTLSKWSLVGLDLTRAETVLSLLLDPPTRTRTSSGASTFSVVF